MCLGSPDESDADALDEGALENSLVNEMLTSKTNPVRGNGHEPAGSKRRLGFENRGGCPVGPVSYSHFATTIFGLIGPFWLDRVLVQPQPQGWLAGEVLGFEAQNRVNFPEHSASLRKPW